MFFSRDILYTVHVHRKLLSGGKKKYPKAKDFFILRPFQLVHVYILRVYVSVENYLYKLFRSVRVLTVLTLRAYLYLCATVVYDYWVTPFTNRL